MEDHDYAELGAPKKSKSKKPKQAKEVEKGIKPKEATSLKRPNKEKQFGDIKRTSSSYGIKDSEKLQKNVRTSNLSESLDIAPYATIPRKDRPPKEQNEAPKRNGSVNHKNGNVQSRDRLPHTNVNNVNGSAGKDSKKMPEKDFSELYAEVNKPRNGRVKTRDTNLSLKEKKHSTQEEDFSQLYAEVNKQRPRSEVILLDDRDAESKIGDILNLANKGIEKSPGEDIESNPYAEIGKRRTSYHGRGNTSSLPRSGKRGSLSLSFRSFRSQKSDVTDGGIDELGSNSLYNLIPEEPDKPMPDIEDAPPLPPENAVLRGQNNSAVQTESANASTSVDVENFEDEGYQEAMRRREIIRREEETRKRRIRFLVGFTIFLFAVLLIVLGGVVYLLLAGGYFNCILGKEPCDR